MFRLLLVILVAVTIIPPGSELKDSAKNPTLAEVDYTAAKMADSNFPDNAQILYCEYNGVPAFGYGEACNLQVYGDGQVLAMHKVHNKEEEAIYFFLSNQPCMLEDLGEALVSQGLFKMQSEGYTFMDLPMSEIHSYYISFRIKEKYYTLCFSGFVGEEPSWLALTEPFRAIMDQIMVDENKIEGTQYLETREEIIKKYGYNIMCGDTGIEKYVGKIGK